MDIFLWSCLLCFLIGPGTSGSDPEAPPVEVNAVLGRDVTFPVRITTGYDFDKILCTFNGDLIAEMTLGSNYTVRDERFAERLCAADASGSLNIRNLTNKDSGSYVMEIFKKEQTYLKETKRYELAVFSRVKPPIIRLLIDRPNGTCLITLNCTVNDSTSEGYSWSGVKIGPSVEPVILLNLTESASNRTVCCTVKNPVSKASACVLPREYCFQDSASKASSCTCGYLLRIIACASSTVICVLVGFIVYKLDQRKDQDLREE